MSSLVRRAAAALYNSSSSALPPIMQQHDIVINNKTVCTTPGATLVASFTVSSDLRTTEKLMVTTTVLMTILGAALFLLGILGRFSGRHRGHSTATRIFFRASFALFLPFMSYMFSQAKSKGVAPRAQLILLWMLLVELLRKKVYTMVAPAGDTFARGVARYSLFHAVEEAARIVWIGYLIYSYVHGFGVKSFFIILWIFSVAKLCKRAISIQLAKKSFDLARNSKLVSGYMAQLVKGRKQLIDDPQAFGPNVMRTCNYVVMGESRLERDETPHGYEIRDLQNILDGGSPNGVSNNFDLVRVSTIWQLAESDQLFRYDKGRRRKLEDICLALALFKLLRRRFEHCCHMAEAETREACLLVLRGLLALEGEQDEAADAERAFEVVELELRFLEEYYQAVIPLALPKPVLFLANFVFSIVFILVYCITVLLVTGNGNIFNVLGSLFRGLVGLSIDLVVQFRCFRHQVSFLVGMVCSSSDLIITFLLTLTFLAVEMYEFLQYQLSDWFLASVLCNYARKPALRGRPQVRQAVKCALWVKHRSRPVIKVHQVTMLRLHQLHPRRVWMLISRLLKRRLVGLPDAVVTAEAKVAIVRALKDVLNSVGVGDPSGGFSNGTDALRRYGFPKPKWMSDGGAATVILAWHFATALFEKRDGKEHHLPPEGQAAVTLSRYCAYLVAYEPGLLPDDQAWTEKEYKQFKEDLSGFFQSCCPTPNWRDRLYRLGEEEKSAMAKGVKLSKQLGDMAPAPASVSEGTTSGSGSACARAQNEERVWLMLLEFWAELLVFVALWPSGGPDAHALALANGGEFITHIWAMLTHAGVRVAKPQAHSKDSV